MTKLKAYCDCFRLPDSVSEPVDLTRFDQLHSEGKELIKGWFDRAWNSRFENDEVFESFIFAWFAVNGWAACVTLQDRDSTFMKLLGADDALAARFAELLNSESGFREQVEGFAQFWPIFEVKDLRSNGLRLADFADREQLIHDYLARGATKFEPQCWTQHHINGEQSPRDWQHTIAAIYRVRCNLFHGEKAAHSEMDQRIVGSAFRTLVHFFRGTNLL